MHMSKKIYSILALAFFLTVGLGSFASAQTQVQNQYDFQNMTRSQLLQLIYQLITGQNLPADTSVEEEETDIKKVLDLPNDVSLGSTHDLISDIQEILNLDPDTQVAQFGNGSAGNETDYFGTKTRAAIKNFQAKYGLAVTGTITTETEAKMLEIKNNAGKPVTYSLQNVKYLDNNAIVADEGLVQTASFKLEAVYDSFDIQEIIVRIENPSVVSKVYLTNNNEVIQEKPAATTITFSDINFLIPRNEKKNLDVVLELAEIGPGRGESGANVKTTFISGKAKSKATGNLSNISLASGSISAFDIYVYETIPTITAENLSSTVMLPGTNLASKIKISADSSGSLSWNKIMWTVNKASSVQISSAELYQNGDRIDGNFTLIYTQSGTQLGYIVFNPAEEQYVGAGQFKAYDLKVNIAGAPQQGDYANFQIDASSGYLAPTDYSNVNSDASFVWSDQSAQAHSYNTNDWMNDYLVKNLPLDSDGLSS